MEGSDSQRRLNLSLHSVLLAGRHRNELSWKTIKAAREVETCLLDSGKTPFSWQQRLQSKALRGPGLWGKGSPAPRRVPRLGEVSRWRLLRAGETSASVFLGRRAPARGLLAQMPIHTGLSPPYMDQFPRRNSETPSTSPEWLWRTTSSWNSLSPALASHPRSASCLQMRAKSGQLRILPPIWGRSENQMRQSMDAGKL